MWTKNWLLNTEEPQSASSRVPTKPVRLRSSNASPVYVKGLRSPFIYWIRKEVHSDVINHSKVTFPRSSGDCSFTLLTDFCVRAAPEAGLLLSFSSDLVALIGWLTRSSVFFRRPIKKWQKLWNMCQKYRLFPRKWLSPNKQPSERRYAKRLNNCQSVLKWCS